MEVQKPILQTTAIIIDDDHDIANTFREYLELCRITILGVGHDGKSAVELYQKIKPNVVFLDVMMPDYDGYYGLERIMQFDPSAKVIMVTADVTRKSKDRLTSLGAIAVIYKPVEIEEILTTINRVIHLGATNS